MAENKEHRSLRSRVSEPGSGLQFLAAVVAVLIVGVIIAIAIHFALPNGYNSNDPNKLPDQSAAVHLMRTSHGLAVA